MQSAKEIMPRLIEAAADCLRSIHDYINKKCPLAAHQIVSDLSQKDRDDCRVPGDWISIS